MLMLLLVLLVVEEDDFVVYRRHSPMEKERLSIFYCGVGWVTHSLNKSMTTAHDYYFHSKHHQKLCFFHPDRNPPNSGPLRKPTVIERVEFILDSYFVVYNESPADRYFHHCTDCNNHQSGGHCPYC